MAVNPFQTTIFLKGKYEGSISLFTPSGINKSKIKTVNHELFKWGDD